MATEVFPFGRGVTTFFFSRRLVILWRAGPGLVVDAYTHVTVVTGSPTILRGDHGVTAEFRWTQALIRELLFHTCPVAVIGVSVEELRLRIATWRR